MSKKSLRNTFVALCDNATKNNWCWKLWCTTCGHGAFRVTFSKLIHDLHPDDDSFWPNGKSVSDPLREHEEYNDFWREANDTNQLKLATIVADAKISDIYTVAKYPDWLGYIGLVLWHCPNREAKKIISDSLIPQFIEMTKDDKELNNYLKIMQSDKDLLSINDLSRIESGMVKLDNPPYPLIFDL